MPVLPILLLLAANQAKAAAKPAEAVNPSLWLYDGTWQVTRSNGGKAAAKPDIMVNQCGQIGRYFACQQTVNGKVGGLLLIIPAEAPNHYYTQTVMPEGRATGRDDLEISGDRWTFSSRRLDNGKAFYYRTVNTFSGKNKIHFEQAESTNGTDWTVKNSGDEQRIGPATPGARR